MDDDFEDYFNATVAPETLSAGTAFPPLTMGIASFAFAVLLLALFLYARRRSTSRGNAILLLGPADAGKTTILTSLVYRHSLPSHTSLQTNVSIIALPESKRILQLVDVPGHPRIRDQFQEYLPEARAAIFVVDASTISRNGPAVAEHLHHVLHALTSLPPSQTMPALLILAHKCDLLKTGSTNSSAEDLAINRVRTILERELEKRRATHAGGVGMEALGGEGDGSAELGGLDCNGPAGGTFKFADWEGGEVMFLGTSVIAPAEKSDDTEEKEEVSVGLRALSEWLEDL